jgi:hypothetical protein
MYPSRRSNLSPALFIAVVFVWAFMPAKMVIPLDKNLVLPVVTTVAVVTALQKN